MKISIEPRKGKDIGLTGQQAKRIVWVLVDPSGDFIRRSPTSKPMYGTSKDRAAALIPKALRKLGTEGKESTSTTRKKTTRKKTTRQELTVDSCRSFLESRGYEVTSEGEGYEDQLRAAGWVENPRKRTRKNPPAKALVRREYMVIFDNMGTQDVDVIEAFSLSEAKARARHELMRNYDLEPESVISVVAMGVVDRDRRKNPLAMRRLR